MQNPPRERPVKDERDEMIDRDAKNWSLELMICATQVLTVICAVKGNSAWKGSLSLLFFGIAAALIYKYSMYRERPYLYVGLASLAIGLALIVWFAVADKKTGRKGLLPAGLGFLYRGQAYFCLEQVAVYAYGELAVHEGHKALGDVQPQAAALVWRDASPRTKRSISSSALTLSGSREMFLTEITASSPSTAASI